MTTTAAESDVSRVGEADQLAATATTNKSDRSGKADKSEIPAPEKRSRPRDPFFDNAKFLAIALVVIGHMIEPVTGDVPAAYALYMFLYVFHMPVFIVITGYLARNFPKSSGKARKLVGQLLAPYVVFQIAYMAYAQVFNDKSPTWDLFDPYYLVWFLLAVFLYRLSTPIWFAVRWPLAVAVGIAVFAGTQNLVDEFEMGRTMQLLPFFVLGLMLRPEHLEWLRKGWVRLAGGAVLLGALGFAFWAQSHMSMEWVFYRSNNDTLNVDFLTGSVMRVALLAAAATLVFAFLAITPRGRTWFSELGKYTLYVYLLHGFFKMLGTTTGWWELDWVHSELGFVVNIGVAIVLTLVLSTSPVRRVTHWAVEPSIAWMFRDRRRTT